MTDMHREAFEKWTYEDYAGYIKLLGVSEFFSMSESDGQYDQAWLQELWQGWQAALRYRDEQEKQA